MTPSREVESLGRFRGQGLDPSSQGGAASVLGLPIGDEGNQSAREHLAVDSPALEQPEWMMFTPSNIDPTKCMARTFAGGMGGQCGRKMAVGKRFCKGCARRLAHGAVDGPIPEQKLIEFRKHADLRARKSTDLQAGNGAAGAVSVAANSRESSVSAQEFFSSSGAMRLARVSCLLYTSPSPRDRG